MRRHGRSGHGSGATRGTPWRFTVLAADMAAATAVALLKVDAGYHCWTDVAAGAAVGTSLGVLVLMVHRRW